MIETLPACLYWKVTTGLSLMAALALLRGYCRVINKLHAYERPRWLSS